MAREHTLRRMPSMHNLGVQRDRQLFKRTETVLKSFGAQDHKVVKNSKSSILRHVEPLSPSTHQSRTETTPKARRQLCKSQSLYQLNPPSAPCTPLFLNHPELSDPLSIFLPSTPFSQLDYSICSDDAQVTTAVRERAPVERERQGKQYHLPSGHSTPRKRSSSTSLYPPTTPSTQPSPRLKVYTTITLAQSDVSLLAPSSLGLDMSPLSSSVSLPSSLEAAAVKVIPTETRNRDRQAEILASNTFYLPPVYTKPASRSIQQTAETRRKPSPFKSCVSSNGIESDHPRRRHSPVEGHGSLRNLFTFSKGRQTLPKDFKSRGIKVEISAPFPVDAEGMDRANDKEWRQSLLTTAVSHSLRNQARPKSHQRLRIPSLLTGLGGPEPISPCLTPTVQELEARRRLEMEDDGGLVLPDGFEARMPKGRAATPLANALPPPRRVSARKADLESTVVHDTTSVGNRKQTLVPCGQSSGSKSTSTPSDEHDAARRVLAWRQQVESNGGLVTLEDLLRRFEQQQRQQEKEKRC